MKAGLLAGGHAQSLPTAQLQALVKRDGDAYADWAAACLGDLPLQWLRGAGCMWTAHTWPLLQPKAATWRCCSGYSRMAARGIVGLRLRSLFPLSSDTLRRLPKPMLRCGKLRFTRRASATGSRDGASPRDRPAPPLQLRAAPSSRGRWPRARRTGWRLCARSGSPPSPLSAAAPLATAARGAARRRPAGGGGRRWAQLPEHRSPGAAGAIPQGQL